MEGPARDVFYARQFLCLFSIIILVNRGQAMSRAFIVQKSARQALNVVGEQESVARLGTFVD
jgi:hypothetical protein